MRTQLLLSAREPPSLMPAQCQLRCQLLWTQAQPLQQDAVGNHRSFSDKNGLTSKRELQPEDDMKPAHWKRKRPIEKRTHRIPLGSSRLLIYIQSPVWLCVGMTEKRPVPSNASRISSPQPPQKTSSGPESLLGVFVCVL
ncbi:galanin peptides isoform X3 [Gorilla gorilla gorilla]|uniref:galanin peptides isoform X3 n=1 Tax=Gorilla gorilla gorilla TaxID=9595 RepID=UPI00300B0DB8